MYGKNVLASKGRRLYIATFGFISGEYEQPFIRLFYAKEEKDLNKRIHDYLIDYYGSGNTSEIDENVYYYQHGEVAVKYYGWEEIASFDQLVNKLI